MRCPKCEYLVPEGAVECPRCGVIFARFARKQQREQQALDQARPKRKLRLSLKLTLAGLGLLLAALGLHRFAAGFARGLGQGQEPAELEDEPLEATPGPEALPPVFEEEPEEPEPPAIALPGTPVDSEWQPGMPVPANWREVLGDMAEVIDVAQEAAVKARAGQPEEAARLLEAALREQPEELRQTPGMRRMLAWLYLLSGRKELKRGHPGAALAAFDKGLELAPASAELHADAAKACATLRRYEKALEHVQQALAVQPGRRDLLSVETWLRWRMDDVDGARATAGRLAEQHPHSAGARMLRDRMTREASAEGSRRREGRHFIVRFQGQEDRDAADLVLQTLEQAREQVGRDLGLRPEDPIVALLYTQQQFSVVTRSPGWAGGAYDGKIRLPVGGLHRGTDRLASTVTHEYVHAVLHDVAGANCPAWLHEGTAQYYEPEQPASRLSSRMTRLGGLIPFHSLDAALKHPDPRVARQAYLQCLAVVAYVIEQRGRRDLLAALRRMGEGEAPSSALRAVWGDRPAAVADKAWAHYQGR